MKLCIVQTWGGFALRKPPYPGFDDERLLGTIEVEEPKRVVTKEVIVEMTGGGNSGHIEYKFLIPLQGKNIKCTYEIEE